MELSVLANENHSFLLQHIPLMKFGYRFYSIYYDSLNMHSFHCDDKYFEMKYRIVFISYLKSGDRFFLTGNMNPQYSKYEFGHNREFSLFHFNIMNIGISDARYSCMRDECIDFIWENICEDFGS